MKNIGKDTFKAQAPTAALMKGREKEVDTMYPRPYRKPEVSPGRVEQAAQAVAAWDNSDPFAYGRTALYARQGYIDVEETVSSMNKRALARKVAKERQEREVEIHADNEISA